MLKKLLIASVMLVGLIGCSALQTQPPQPESLTPAEVAKCKIPAIGKLPEPLDLSAYKVAPGSYILYNNGKTYIGIPEDEITKQHSVLLLLKNRVFELQEIILDTNELNK